MRWGILGTGAVAAAFVDGLQFLDGATLQAVGSRTPERAAEFAARRGAARPGTSYDEVVADPDVDVVYVATGNAQHREHALLALAAGKPVLCEKPFALNAADGREVVEAARSAGVFCMEAMWMRCSPVVQEVGRLARGGAVGDLRLVTAELGFPNAVDPASRLFQPDGGGALLDLGVYPVSFVHAILGAPTDVTATAVVGETGVDEQCAAILDYGDGRQAVIAASIRSELSNDAEISGTEGRIRVRPPLVFPYRFEHHVIPPRQGSATAAGPSRLGSARTKIRQHPLGRLAVDVRGAVRSQPTTLRAAGNGYTAEAAEVERCLGLGLTESPVMTLSETVEVLTTLDAIRSSWAD